MQRRMEMKLRFFRCQDKIPTFSPSLFRKSQKQEKCLERDHSRPMPRNGHEHVVRF
jgi:hypothetical protein